MGENLKTEMNNVFAAVLDTHFHAERADLKKTRTTKDLSYLMITTQPLFSPFFPFLFHGIWYISSQDLLSKVTICL